MHCPLDDTALTPRPLGPRRIHECEKCHGVFIPDDLFPEIRAFSALKFHEHGRNFDGPDGSPPSARVSCVNDGGPMAAFVFKGVEIDVCPRCSGVWLDAGELEKIAAQVRPPRKDKASTSESRLEVLEDAQDLADTASSIDSGIVDGVVDFVTDVVGSLFDGISL